MKPAKRGRKRCAAVPNLYDLLKGAAIERVGIQIPSFNPEKSVQIDYTLSSRPKTATLSFDVILLCVSSYIGSD